MKDLSLEEFEVLLCSTGYLPPRNEDELMFFNQMYEGYESKLADRHVDVESIFSGSCRVVSGYALDYDELKSSTQIAAEEHTIYSMAARNYGKLPEEILKKMKNQHKTPKVDEDEK